MKPTIYTKIEKVVNWHDLKQFLEIKLLDKEIMTELLANFYDTTNNIMYFDRLYFDGVDDIITACENILEDFEPSDSDYNNVKLQLQEAKKIQDFMSKNDVDFIDMESMYCDLQKKQIINNNNK